ncbi:MAG TPA: hypothetical protein VFU50_17525 [Terriglobales bacterium]|nr:hypothetical protein [Terriglobales bacterium]
MNKQIEFALFVVVGIVFYSAVRLMFTRKDKGKLGDYAPLDPRLERRFDHAFAGSSRAAREADLAPVSDHLGRVRVTQFNFEHFDAAPGPPDPDCFADELIIELYDSASDFRWTVTYVVATPAGIRKRMDDEQWNFLYATEIFIVRTYNLETIRRAVYGRIREIHDQVALDPEEPPTYTR